MKLSLGDYTHSAFYLKLPFFFRAERVDPMVTKQQATFMGRPALSASRPVRVKRFERSGFRQAHLTRMLLPLYN